MQPAESDTFAWGLACATAARDESPTKRRRTATQRFVEQEQQQQLEVGTPTKGPTRRSRTKTWPSESSSLWASRERSQDKDISLLLGSSERLVAMCVLSIPPKAELLLLMPPIRLHGVPIRRVPFPTAQALQVSGMFGKIGRVDCCEGKTNVTKIRCNNNRRNNNRC